MYGTVKYVIANLAVGLVSSFLIFQFNLVVLCSANILLLVILSF